MTTYDREAEHISFLDKREASWKRLQNAYEEQVRVRDEIIALYRELVRLLLSTGVLCPDPGLVPFEETSQTGKEIPS